MPSELAPGSKYHPCSPRTAAKEPEAIEGVWIPVGQGTIYRGKPGASGQRDRDTKAYWSHAYAKTLEKLRARTFKGAATNVPIEYFEFERLIVDEFHEVVCPDALGGGAKENKIHMAARELLGVGQANLARRPLRARRGIIGLTATPMLGHVSRITETAALCSGAYVCGAGTHWRRLERAGVRDIFLDHRCDTPSDEYKAQCARHAAAYLMAGVQRNKGEDIPEGKEICCEVRMSEETHERFVRALPADFREQGSLALMREDYADAITDVGFVKLLGILGAAQERKRALVELLQRIHKEDPTTKIVVLAPAGDSFDAAWAAASSSGVSAMRLVEDDDEGVDASVAQFGDEDITEEDAVMRPRVLVLPFRACAGFNFQHVSRDVVLYAPLWLSEDGVAAASKETQGIGRVARPGQKRSVRVHRILLQSPAGEKTVDHRVKELNTSEYVKAQITTG